MTTKILAVLQREWYELRAPRTLATLGLFALLQLGMMLAAKVHGRLENSMLLFQLGGVMALVLSFDIIAREREHRTIDLLLVGGLPRGALFAAKLLASRLFSLVCALVLTAAIALGGAVRGMWPSMLDILIQLGMIFWLLALYGLLALVCSAACRRGKWAFITALISWVLLRPPVQALLVIGPLGGAFGWEKQQVWQYLAFLPEFAFRIGLDPLRAAPEGVILSPAASFLALGVSCAWLALLAYIIFVNQDERE